ncbi:CaiB/BaiF CoA transferase family protein [Aeromicrobium duanguangcaii]|uniref:CoA transferase n=1 Tax=Aeromicrobium duanguangcaii TaxID=2968086 RepID=A0ABY5KJV2_9ACTN|nr:CoA transferase [Aeromicrobium duanguangcaii]MCD9153138.1 CoA transferase [Aeromicrobium duanguangcaii]UUI69761.1 CoA transferase [Aeromicrobium duanguangcaii]
MSAPLTGIRVLDLTQYIAGPGATSVLADLGADVIKVEPVRGEATRHLGSFGQGMFHAYNRGKRSIAVNLATTQGRDIASSLMAGADVVVQNLRPGAMERMGLGPNQVRQGGSGRPGNPGLIHVSISGFGSSGVAAKRAGLDIAAQAESGLMSITGETDREPQRVGFAVVDVATANAAAQAILAALLHRERGGPGADIDLSLIETAINIQSANLIEYFSTGRVPFRSGNGQPSAAPAADLIRTRDGHIVLSSYTPPHWAKLCALIGRPELVNDPRLGTLDARVANRDFLHEVLDSAFESMDADACVEWLAENGLVAGAVRTYEQMAESDNVKELGIIGKIENPSHDTPDRYVRLPYRISTVDDQSGASRAPHLGEHTVAILAELGHSQDRIDELVENEVVVANADIPPTSEDVRSRVL